MWWPTEAGALSPAASVACRELLTVKSAVSGLLEFKGEVAPEPKIVVVVVLSFVFLLTGYLTPRNPPTDSPEDPYRKANAAS